MRIYKVKILIEEVDEGKSCLSLGQPYEIGEFNTEAAARKFVENELMTIRTINTKLQNACRAGLKFLDSLGKTNLMNTMGNLAACRKKLKEAVSCKAPAVDDSCPKCGAGSEEREFKSRDIIDIEAIQVHYICKRCGSEIIEEFTLTDVFIDNPHN